MFAAPTDHSTLADMFRRLAEERDIGWLTAGVESDGDPGSDTDDMHVVSDSAIAANTSVPVYHGVPGDHLKRKRTLSSAKSPPKVGAVLSM